MPAYKIVDVTPENFESYNLFRQKSRAKERGYPEKSIWYKKRFREGLKIKLLMVDEGRQARELPLSS